MPDQQRPGPRSAAQRAADLTDRPVNLAAASMRTRPFGSFEVFASWLPPGADASPSVEAARTAFAKAGITPADVQIAQLQDTDSGAEIIHMAETGLCAHGEQLDLLRADETSTKGRLPINTDGGLIANGEPIGASGLRQVHELVHQLRGTAGDRQVPGEPKVGYAQLYGAPGTAGVSILSR